jgi:hypothetical protein
MSALLWFKFATMHKERYGPSGVRYLVGRK